MGVKKIARPMNKAKNDFVKWLKKNKAENIGLYFSDHRDTTVIKQGWDYYCCVTASIGHVLYDVTFSVWKGEESVDYYNGLNKYEDISIAEFYDIINQ